MPIPLKRQLSRKTTKNSFRAKERNESGLLKVFGAVAAARAYRVS